jgi:hypothetical protein
VKADGVHFGHFEMVVVFFGIKARTLFVRKHKYYDAGLIEVSQHPIHKMIEFEKEKKGEK